MKTISKIFAIVLVLGLVFGFAPTADVLAATNVFVVTPATPDWIFYNDNGTTGDWTATFEVGPGFTPPLGIGSATIELNSASAGILLTTQKYQGVRLADITALRYSTYTNLSPAAMTFQINYDPDVTTVEGTTWYGRLTYEPYMSGTVTNDTWQTWDMLASGANWWASPNGPSTVDDACPQSAPCTLAALLSAFPNIGIRNDALSGIGFKAGSNWNGFIGNVDNFIITTAGNTDIFDFEPLMDAYVDDDWSAVAIGDDPDGAGPAQRFGFDSFISVGEGVSAVAAGGKVNVADGFYTVSSTIVLDKAVTVTGPDSGVATLSGTGTTAADLSIFDIRSGDVTLQKLDITHANLPAFGAFTWNELNWSLVKVTPVNAGLTGISITQNKIYVPVQAGEMTTWGGVAVAAASGSVSGINITANSVYNTRNGIVLQYNNTATITGNTIYNTKGGIMNYTGTQADADARVMINNSWTSAHNEWDIVWNSGGGPYAMDMNKSVLLVSQANNDAYVMSKMTTGILATLTGNRSHAFVATTGTTTLNPGNGNINLPYALIQDGINAVVPGGTVYVADGTYLQKDILINKSLTLLGDPGDETAGPGVNAPLVDGGGTYGDAFKLTNGVTNVTIKGFEVANYATDDYDGVGNAISAWVGSTSNITIQDNYFHDLEYNGVIVGNDYNADPSKWGDHTNWLIKGNILEDFGYIGFELTNTSDSTVEGNVIHMSSPIIGAFFSSARRSESGLTIKDNYIDGTPSTAYPIIYFYAYDLDMTAPNLDDVIITGNTIAASAATPFQVYVRNIGTGTITNVVVEENSLKSLKNLTSQNIDASPNWWGTAIESLILPKISGDVTFKSYYIDAAMTMLSEPLPNEVWVDDDYTYSPESCGTHICGYDGFITVQEGIDGVADGGTVNVAAGTYDEENILISKGLTLQGAGASTTFIAPSVVTNNSTIHVLNPTGNVKIDGFTFTMQPKVEYGSAVAVTGTLIPVDSATVTISNNVVNGSDDGTKSDFGFYGQGNNAKLVITNNIINKTGDNPIVMENQAGSTSVTNNTFYITSSPDYNPYFSMAYSGTSVTTPQIVEGNAFHIDHSGSGYAEAITFDTAVLNAWNGITTDTGHYTDILIKNNTIYTEGPFARGVGLVDLSSADGFGTISEAEITGNQIIGENLTDDQTFGITLRGDIEGTLIQNNSISDLKLGIWYRVGANSVCPSGTDLDKNQLVDLGTAIQNDCTATADASPTWWGSAAGPDPATIIGPVDYIPWCTNPECTAFYGPVHNVTQDTYFGTIQAAIDDAATKNGDVIEVAAGTYTGPLLINKSVTLLGPNSAVNPNTGTRVAEAVLQGTTNSGLSQFVNIDATNVVIKGFTFNNLRIDNYYSSTHEQITGDVVENNYFTNVAGTPIYLRDGRDAPGQYSSGVNISNNKIDPTTSMSSTEDYKAGSGIVLFGAESSTVSNNVVISAAYNGIQLARCNEMTISGNIATGTAQPALQIAQWNDGTFTISGNTFSTTSTTKAAIRLYAFTNNFYPLFNFTGNTIKDSKFGIQIGHGDPGKGYNDIRDADYSFSGNTFTNISTYRLIIYLATEATVAEKAEMDALFAGVYGAGNTATAITSADPFTYVVTACTTDCYIAKTGDDLNPGTESAPFLTIQKGIDAVSAAGTVHVAAGTYVENVRVNKAVEIAGAGQTSTFVIPALSAPNPCSNSTLCGGSASNVFLVEANNVKIHDLTVDGDNPALTSGIVRGTPGADLNARNGIVKNTNATYNNLEVYNTSVKNIYLRGIYSTGGSFNFHDNVVTNVQGDGSSIAIFAWYGPGIFQNNTVSYANDGISANHSNGIQWLGNTVTMSGSGIHTDNSGDGGGVSDVISGNTVDCSGVPNAYGIWTFVNYLPITVQNNTVTGCAVAYSSWGGKWTPPTQTVTFTGNTASAPVPNTNSVGLYLTTDTISWGYSDLSVVFENNTLTGFDYGIQIEAGPASWNPYAYVAKTISGTIKRNNITGSTSMAVYRGEQGTYTVTLDENWWGSVLGPQAPISEDVDVIQWCGTANPTCEPLMPQNGNELTLSGTVDLGAINGLYVPEITILLSDGTTIQNTGEACFNVFADHTTIMAESKLGAKCVPAAGKNGVNVAAELQDINIINLEFDGSAGGVTGALFSGVVDYLTILDNWFHDFTGNAVEFQDQPTGVLGIQGNLFQENGGNGIQSYGSTIPAEFNAWGHIDGPAMGDGISNGVDADPWTHVDLYLYSTSPVSIGGQVTYTVYGNLANVMGAGFTLAYPTAKLQLVPASLTNLSSFVEVAPGAGVFDTTTAGEIRFAGTVSGSAAVSGKNMPIYSVEFNVLGDGGLLDLVEAGSDFPMASETADPTWTPAFSTNIYPMTFLDALVTINSYTVQGTFMMEYRYLNVRSGIPGALTGTSYGLYKATSVQAIPNNLKFLSVAPGTYTLTTNQPRYLNLTADLAKTVTVGSSNVTFSTPLTLIAGNAIWSDNEINITDAGLVGGKYGWNVGTSGATDADVDFSGAVGLSDLAIVGKNYGKSSAVNYSWLP